MCAAKNFVADAREKDSQHPTEIEASRVAEQTYVSEDDYALKAGVFNLPRDDVDPFISPAAEWPRKAGESASRPHVDAGGGRGAAVSGTTWPCARHTTVSQANEGLLPTRCHATKAYDCQMRSLLWDSYYNAGPWKPTSDTQVEGNSLRAMCLAEINHELVGPSRATTVRSDTNMMRDHLLECQYVSRKVKRQLEHENPREELNLIHPYDTEHDTASSTTVAVSEPAMPMAAHPPLCSNVSQQAPPPEWQASQPEQPGSLQRDLHQFESESYGQQPGSSARRTQGSQLEGNEHQPDSKQPRRDVRASQSEGPTMIRDWTFSETQASLLSTIDHETPAEMVTDILVAFVCTGMRAEMKCEIEAVLRRGAERYKLWGNSLLASVPTKEVLAKKLLRSRVFEDDRTEEEKKDVVYYKVCEFIMLARARRSG